MEVGTLKTNLKNKNNGKKSKSLNDGFGGKIKTAAAEITAAEMIISRIFTIPFRHEYRPHFYDVSFARRADDFRRSDRRVYRSGD